MAHLCGLCLTLRAEHGQAARLVTNYDGLLVSVLVEAQAPELSPRRKAGPCALRGMQTAEVVTARAQGARLAAAASLLLAAARPATTWPTATGPTPAASSPPRRAGRPGGGTPRASEPAPPSASTPRCCATPSRGSPPSSRRPASGCWT